MTTVTVTYPTNPTYQKALETLNNEGFLYIEEMLELFGKTVTNNLLKKGYIEYDNEIGRYLVSSDISLYFEGYVTRKGEYTRKYFQGY